MPRLTRESEVMIGSKELKIEDILKTIVYLPANQVRSFFMEIGLTIPRELRMFVLRETLREKVIETRKSRLTLADELNYRLSWFTEFTETQLENLLVFFDDPKLNKDFLEEFWTDLFAYMVDKQVPAKDLKRLVDMSIEYVKQVGLEMPDMKTYNRELKDLFFDSMGRIDGLAPAKFRPVLFKSSTLNEIRDLGSKYDVDVPRRLKKSELADIIIDELKDRGQHTDELEKQVRSMSVIIMQRFAVDHDIKASTELKKEEIIEYILANAKETKEAYFIPDSPRAYEKEVEEVQDEKEEETEEAPETIEEVDQQEPEVEEEVIEPTDDEEVVETAEVEEEIESVETVVEPEETEEVPVEKVYVQQPTVALDTKEFVEELRRLRLAVEHIYEDQKALHQEAEPKPLSKAEPIILNSAEFFGTPKHLKKAIKTDEADERERFIEERKAQSSIGTSKSDEESDVPGELRFFGKVFKGLGKFLLKALKILLKVVLVLGSLAVILFAIYATLTYFVTLDFLSTFNQTIDGWFNNYGLLTRFHGLLQSIFG